VRVRYTLPALADLEAILDYIGAQSPRGAKRVQAKIKSVIDLLPRQPLIGTRTDDPPIRCLVVAPYPYLVFYEPTADEIVIHAIRHAARRTIATPSSRS
jgi:plasmid stabilization system protein ParE